MSNPVGRPVSRPCGTWQAYKRAIRRKKKGQDHCGPCSPCKAAYAAWMRDYYARTKGIK